MRSLKFLFLSALVLSLGIVWLRPANTDETKFPPIINTQKPGENPPSAQEAARKITVPPGFKVTLFAGDPDVQQPIAMNIDDRGRLWVAESYTYAADNPGGKRWDKKFRDRVLIFEDSDNDGHFDKRTVFWDQAQNLSSVITGFDGVWLLCAPNLLFIPDRNHDDVPDGPPEVVLDGWVVRGVGHNIVNGLTWGPDGWLYGRHGIQNTSHVGRPGTPPEKRIQLNCSIWRYHPTRKTFEVVTNGTTNPWGFDYDDHGQMFFTNNVIGHLWHVIPGAHFKRMYGEDFNPHLYDLIDQHADHYHWDTGKAWHQSRDNKGKNDILGGGHSHCGGMIYLGDNWPARYRNTIFMCNTHGRRVNNDRLIRHGSGYVGKHKKDFLFANNPWFRGITLLYGPDGGVYLSDWVDLGECHDHDGVHRTSGRIYKIVYKRSPRHGHLARVSKLSNKKLVALQLHKNDWYVRAARRNLQERAAAGQNMNKVHAALREMYENNPDVTRKLRAMWCLYVTGGTSEKWLQKQLHHKSEHIRVWAIRLLVDDGKTLSKVTLDRFKAMAENDSSGLVRLFLASALQRMPERMRLELAEPLVLHAEDAKDHNMPLMIWYGIEPVVPVHPKEAIELARISRIPLIRKYIARRVTENIDRQPRAVKMLVDNLANKKLSARDVLEGMWEGLQGRRKAPAPENWNRLLAKLSESKDKKVHDLVRKLGVVFGDGRAVEELRQLARDSKADGEARRAALKTLIESRAKNLKPMLLRLLNDRATVGIAVKGLAAYDDPKIPKLIISRYRFLKKDERPAAIDTLVSRPAFAKELLQAVAQDSIARADISAYHARQILNFKRDDLRKQLSEVWGVIRDTPAAKKKLIEHYKKLLTGATLKKANLSQGRLLFQNTCGKCHKLYGQGAVVGPDLTGSNRHNLDYLLENIIFPSAVVPVDSRMSIVVLKNGQVYTGVVTGQKERVITVQTQTEKIKVDRDDVEEIQATTVSLMPEEQLTPLSESQVRDLIAYLMSRDQVPLPPGAKTAR